MFSPTAEALSENQVHREELSRHADLKDKQSRCILYSCCKKPYGCKPEPYIGRSLVQAQSQELTWSGDWPGKLNIPA